MAEELDLSKILVSKEVYLSGKSNQYQTSEYLEEYICFLIDKEAYAIEIELVNEIINADNITQVPGGPEYLQGIISLRGNMIALWDLNYFLKPDTTTKTKKKKIIIIHYENRVIGLLVDEILKIQPFTETQLLDAKEVIENADEKNIRLVAKLEDQLVVIPHLSKIFSAA